MRRVTGVSKYPTKRLAAPVVLEAINPRIRTLEDSACRSTWAVLAVRLRQLRTHLPTTFITSPLPKTGLTNRKPVNNTNNCDQINQYLLPLAYLDLRCRALSVASSRSISPYSQPAFQIGSTLGLSDRVHQVTIITLLQTRHTCYPVSLSPAEWDL